MRRLSVRVETDGALIQWLAAARQRKVTSTTLSFSLRVVVFSFSTVLAELLKTWSCLESRAQCWFAADIAASLADAGPPRDERADTVKLSGPIGNGCVTCAALQPETSAATAAALARANIVRMETINRVAHHNRVAALDPKIE